jgi:hypothetical protein
MKFDLDGFLFSGILRFRTIEHIPTVLGHARARAVRGSPKLQVQSFLEIAELVVPAISSSFGQ